MPEGVRYERKLKETSRQISVKLLSIKYLEVADLHNLMHNNDKVATRSILD